MPYEDTQRGNPHQLTKKQHIFPESCIKRFIDSSGQVEVLKKLLNQSEFRSPGNSIFCAKRVWDQKAESGIMKEIEDKFKTVAEAIIVRGTTINDPNENSAIEDFYALWCSRVKHDSIPIPDPQLQGISGTSQVYTQDEEERMEKSWVSFIRPDATIPSRFLIGDQIMLEIINWRLRYKNTQWALIRSSKGEFIIPDIPCARIIPLTPTLCLGSELGRHIADMVITEEGVKKINIEAINASRVYYFGRDLSICPK